MLKKMRYQTTWGISRILVLFTRKLAEESITVLVLVFNWVSVSPCSGTYQITVVTVVFVRVHLG